MTAATESKLRVLVTGGAAGIGNATARSFLLRGAKVVICDADAAGLQRAMSVLSRLPEANHVPADWRKRPIVPVNRASRGSGGPLRLQEVPI
jgi:NAD(P)-dependent dehydrogenase (short-subunit alcohol dehydrogenase family)